MKKGFTLIELLVVVLIIGVLAAIALPQYFKAVERSRMSEAEQLLTSIAQAQQRKYLQLTEFATKYTGLDVAPKGAVNAAYCTKGTVPSGGTEWTGASVLDQGGAGGSGITCAKGNGFLIAMQDGVWGKGTGTEVTDPKTAGVGYAVAKRVNGDSTGDIQYQYQLVHFYAGNATACKGFNPNGTALCADFCGIDTLTQGNYCCNDGSAVSGAGGNCPVPAKAGNIN